MAKVKFYTDEHIARAVIPELRQHGVDAHTAAEANLLGAADEEHLDRARDENRVLVTQDADFLRLHAAGASHHGIVYAPQGTRIGDLFRGLPSQLIHEVLEAEEMVGRVEFL